MSLKVGDTIKCTDPDDLIENMTEYAKAGVDTDFQYEVNRGGQRVLPRCNKYRRGRRWLKKRTLKTA